LVDYTAVQDASFESEPDIMVFAGLTVPNAILAQATEIVE
jgi:hypothetical protein